jgi:multidrug resistance efflux pump
MTELGDHVRAGAPLVIVISGDLADLRNARDKAAVDLAAAKQNDDRVAALVEAGSLPRKELLSVRQHLAEARVALSSAEQKLASLRVRYSEAAFTIPAPREGIIVDKHVAVGQQVSPDSGAVLAVADLAAVWLVAYLLEDAVDDSRPGSSSRTRRACCGPTPWPGSGSSRTAPARCRCRPMQSWPTAPGRTSTSSRTARYGAGM